MPDTLPTINNEPAQGIQALLDTVYLWNPDVANELIEQVNELLEELGEFSDAGCIKPYDELTAPVRQYLPCYNGDNVYVASADIEELPEQFNPAQWTLIATKAPVLQAGAGIDINGNEISVEQQVLSDAAAGATAVQPEDLGTAAYASTSDFATATQGGKADTAVQPGDLGTAAYAASTDFATSAQGGKADTALQPSDIVDNLNSTATNKALSANQGKELEAQITALEGRGRYLSSWNCATGLAATNPPTSPYTYRAGDYFIVGTVDTTTNYKPSGSQYVIGTASSTVETEEVAVNDTYTYDGTNWSLLKTSKVDALPPQTGNEGKVLTTDGTDAAWSNTVSPLEIQTTGANIYGQSTKLTFSTVVEGVTTSPVVMSSNGSGQLVITTPNGMVFDGYTLMPQQNANSRLGFELLKWDSIYVTRINNGEFISVPTVGGSIAVQVSSMPTAAATLVGQVYQFIGATDQDYTNSYFYKCVTGPSDATISQTTGSSLSDLAVNVTTFETQITTTGDYEFLFDGTDWSYDGNTVTLADYGITFTGAPVADDVITVSYASVTYAWSQTDVQPAPDPLPSQSGNAGKFLTTDGTDASWSDKPLVNNATGSQSIGIGQFQYQTSGSNSIAIGDHSGARGDSSVALGASARGDTNYTVSVGPYANIHYGTVQSKAYSTAVGASAMSKGLYSVSLGCTAVTEATGGIQIGYGTNSEAGTLSIGLTTATSPWTSTNYKLLDSDGTIPTARFTTDPVSDGTYYPTLTISSGTPTRSWSTISALQNTATGNQSFTVGGTPTNSNYSMNIGLNSSVSGNYSLAIGRYATVTDNNSVVIGGGSARGRYDVVLGNGNIASGSNGSIVIGNSENITPIEESNVAVFMLNGQNYKILDSDGSIPTDRLAKNSIQHYTIMPAANPNLNGVIAQYVGATDGSYTNGYFYKCSQGTSSATASQTTGSSLSDVAVVVATFETQATDSGSYVFTYSAADSAWIHDYLIADLVDWGITYTGAPVDGDVITVVYDNGLGWTQTDVQPGSSLPSQTGNSGKFLTTDGTVASWGNALVNTATDATSLSIFGSLSNYAGAVALGPSTIVYSHYGTAVGSSAKATYKATAIGYNTNANENFSTVIGYGAVANARYAIQIGVGNNGTGYANNDASTLKVGNANGNFEIMSADGTIPTARFTTDPVSDGTYIPTVTLSSGTATRSWETPITITFRTWGANE